MKYLVLWRTIMYCLVIPTKIWGQPYREFLNNSVVVFLSVFKCVREEGINNWARRGHGLALGNNGYAASLWLSDKQLIRDTRKRKEEVKQEPNKCADTEHVNSTVGAILQYIIVEDLMNTLLKVWYEVHDPWTESVLIYGVVFRVKIQFTSILLLMQVLFTADNLFKTLFFHYYKRQLKSFCLYIQLYSVR